MPGLKHLTLAVSLLAANATSLFAQSFVAPNAVEYTFGDPMVHPAGNTSCYSLEAGYAYFPDMVPAIGTAYANLYVAGWNNQDIGGMHEVTVLLTASGDPSNVLWKASIPYTDVQDLEVGSLRNTATNNTNVLVAYYKPGTGHMLDIYELSPSPANPYQLINQMVLSNSPTYGRIRMDFHATYDCAIAWVNTQPGPNKGIQTIVYTNNTWSGVTTLTGTANKTGVDIAVTRVIEPVNNSGIAYPLHFVYSGGGFVTEASVDMTTLAASPGFVTPSVNDNFYVGAGLNSRLVLDCADFSRSSTVANGSAWAYTYSDGMNIIVRTRNATLPAAQTAIVTSGMLGNSPLDPVGGVYRVFNPAINYGAGYPGSLQEEIMVTWYATDGGSNNGYMGLQMDPNATSVISTYDYLLLPHANTPTMDPSFVSGIALSKTGPKAVHQFLYATYYDIDPSTGDYQLHHAFHKWGDVVFKGEGSTGAPAKIIAGTTSIDTYPNPFSNMLSTSVSLREAGVLRLELHDLAGRLVWQSQSTLAKGNHEVRTEDVKGLSAGTYMLSASLNNRKIGTRMVVKQ
jgi:hypothetical protein